MKTFPSGLQTAIAKSATTLCECLSIARQDGVTIRLTTHSEDVAFDDGDGTATYAADPGFYREAISYGRTLEPERVSVYGLFAGDLSQDAVRQRRFDGAEVSLWLVDYSAPSTDFARLLKGTMGRIEPRGAAYRAELLGLKNKLKRLIVESVSPQCRADLGDARCGVALTSFPGTLSGVTSKRVLVASGFAGSAVPSFFDDGKITFTSGALSGLSFQVAKWVQATKTMTLVFPLPVLPSAGDGFNLFQGCTKQLAFCQDVFDNVVNFRGEPHIPEPAQLVAPPLVTPGGSYQGTGGQS